MQTKLKIITKKISDIDTQTIGLIIIIIVAISVTFSSAKIIQKNYTLQQEITKLQQQNSLQEQTNANQALKNEYFKTDAYLDIATRRYTNKVAEGEKLYLVPKDVALKFVKPLPAKDDKAKATKPKFVQNWINWFKFLGGQNIEP